MTRSRAGAALKAPIPPGPLREQVPLPDRGAGLDTFTEAEHNKQGYFFVERILKHKYKHGFHFLTKWQEYPVNDSTWEPISAFVQPNGQINTQFQHYCQENNLDRAYRKALELSRACRF